MLTHLKISNYAIIDELDIQFHQGMLAITGETGAGKSIILGALGLALGDRVDNTVLKNNDTKCVIEATFNLSGIGLTSFFKKNELDFEELSILRREITAQGKSRAFINDTPVSLGILKELSERLIDVHSQHQTLLLNKERFQLEVVDAYAKNDEIKKSYKETYTSFIEVKKAFTQLKEDEQKLKNDLEFSENQLKELKEIDLDNLNERELLDQLDDLNNAEDIKRAANSIYEALDGDRGFLNGLYLLQQELERGGGIQNKRIAELAERLKSIVIETKDIAAEAESVNEDILLDDELAFQISERVTMLKKLHGKHYTHSIEELIAIREELEQKVDKANSFDNEIDRLSKELVKQENELTKLANQLTQTRKGIAQKLADEIKSLLHSLSMKDAVFSVEIDPLQEFSSQGLDKITFLFNANKGMTPNPIDKVASGGELSRLMLCIKKVLANTKKLPTIIFDEIDTGVSGEVAFKMGEMMKLIAKNTQVFAITHLPQIASKGHHHYFVYKKEKEGKTVTKLKHLTYDERVRATASMLSGSQVTDEAIKNAQMLLG